MKQLTLLLFILGALAPAYLQASTSASANISAGEVKSAAADLKSLCATIGSSSNSKSDGIDATTLRIDVAAAQQAIPLLIPENIIPRAGYDGVRVKSKFTEEDCKRIIEWLKEDPHQHKNACDKYGKPLLWVLCLIRFDYDSTKLSRNRSPALQPAIDFLLNLKPSTRSQKPTERSFQGISSSSEFNWIVTLPGPQSNLQDQADFCRLAQRITRLMFLNGRDLLQIREDAVYLRSEYKQCLDNLNSEVGNLMNVSHAGKDTIKCNQERVAAFQAALTEVEAIRQEGITRITLNRSKPLKAALLPVLRRIVANYVTEVSMGTALRALEELSAPKSLDPAQ